jgi:alkylation response protein AidB-like acyl-CoA dehydrogenase
MDFELTEDQRAFANTARQFALAELAPHAAHWDAEGIFPREAIAKAGELGFCGLYAPESAGGLALPRLDATLVFEEMAAVDPSTTAFITIHNMATWMLGTWAQPEVRDHWGPLLTSGQRLASYCLTEPGAGSDAASLKTRAELVGNEYIINGSKAFISGAGSTDVLVLMARTGDAQSGAAGISAFAVPADAPGISYGKKEEKMGWNSQPTRQISFDNVRIPANHLLGREGEGFKIAMKGLDGGRVNISSSSPALWARPRARSSRRSSTCTTASSSVKPIASFQALQFKLGRHGHRTRGRAPDGAPGRQQTRRRRARCSTYCAMAKRFATDAGFIVCNEALQLHGGYGYIREYPLERLMRDARVHQILEGTNEIMRVIIARRMLDGDAPDAIR